MSVNSKMTAINDKIRTILGTTGIMGLDAMATNLGTVQTNIESAFTEVGNKGGTVPSSKVIGNLLSAINSIPSGAKVKTGTYTPASNTSAGSTAKLAHNAGFIPRIFIMYRNSGATPSLDHALTFFGKYITDPKNGRGAAAATDGRSSTSKNAGGFATISLSGSNSAFKDTTTQTTFWGANNGAQELNLKSGDTYTWIAVNDWEGNF